MLRDLSNLAELDKWAGINSIIAVERIRAAHGRAKVTSHYRFYLSSLTGCASDFAALTRQHWHIENKLHWRREREAARRDRDARQPAAVSGLDSLAPQPRRT